MCWVIAGHYPFLWQGCSAVLAIIYSCFCPPKRRTRVQVVHLFNTSECEPPTAQIAMKLNVDTRSPLRIIPEIMIVVILMRHFPDTMYESNFIGRWPCNLVRTQVCWRAVVSPCCLENSFSAPCYTFCAWNSSERMHDLLPKRFPDLVFWWCLCRGPSGCSIG